MLKHTLFIYTALSFTFAAAFTNAEEKMPTLTWPLACTAFKDCFIQSYPDLRMGANLATPMDYKCGERAQPGLKGTQIVFKDRATTQGGQPVLAAADGRVLFIENSLKDERLYSQRSKRACGNHIVVRHSASWRTKYCHLRQNSTAVEIGQKVKAGEKLAEIGSSGATQEPLLYFELQKEGVAVDPFTARVLNTPTECFSLADKSLWQTKVPYPKAGVVSASFAPVRPTAVDLAFKSETFATLSSASPVLSAWVKVFGIEKGDLETFTVTTPSGKVWHKTERLHPIAAPFWTAILSATPNEPLKKGIWHASYVLTRGGEVVLEKNFQVTLTR